MSEIAWLELLTLHPSPKKRIIDQENGFELDGKRHGM
jgi:hypothetical protein